MSLKNFLDLRKKTPKQIRVIEKIILQKRSLKSDIFLAFSVILAASGIIWGISMADYSPQTNVNGAQTVTEGNPSSIIPDTVLSSSGTTGGNDNAGEDDNAGGTQTSTEGSTTNISISTIIATDTTHANLDGEDLNGQATTQTIATETQIGRAHV